MMLSPLWEFWNWTNGSFLFWGVILLLYAAYVIGFGQGRWRWEWAWNELPLWVQLGLIALGPGILMVLAYAVGLGRG